MDAQAEKAPKKKPVVMTPEEVAKTLERADFYDKALDKLPEWWRKRAENLNGFALAKAWCAKARYVLSRNMLGGTAAEYVTKAAAYYETAHDRISDWASDPLP